VSVIPQRFPGCKGVRKVLALLLSAGFTLGLPVGKAYGQSQGVANEGVAGLLLSGLTPRSVSDSFVLPQDRVTAEARIVVVKAQHTLSLFSGNTLVKAYHIALGEGGHGDKEREGDKKTPEGSFYIAERSVMSPPDKYLGSRWMRLSYPNIEDAKRGLSSGMINKATHDQIVTAINNRQIPPQKTALGGGVGIHGGSNSNSNWGDSWTYGCLGLTNTDANELYRSVQVGTAVEIQR